MGVDGIEVDTHLNDAGDAGRPHPARRVLRDPAQRAGGGRGATRPAGSPR
ncbi:MAG: hypothetical protein MZV64_14730 [Ignavibacteriales bacterium]|nr:hypothetical protein [Ignavibacteriales bacterium]